MPIPGHLSRKIREVLTDECADDLFAWMRGVELYGNAMSEVRRVHYPRIERQLAALRRAIDRTDGPHRREVEAEFAKLHEDFMALRHATF